MDDDEIILRDWFAGIGLLGLMSSEAVTDQKGKPIIFDAEWLSQMSYAYADKMITQRKKQTPTT